MERASKERETKNCRRGEYDGAKFWLKYQAQKQWKRNEFSKRAVGSDSLIKCQQSTKF